MYESNPIIMYNNFGIKRKVKYSMYGIANFLRL